MKFLSLLLCLPIARAFLAPAVPLANTRTKLMATTKKKKDWASDVVHGVEDFLGSLHKMKINVLDPKTEESETKEEKVDDSWIAQDFEEVPVEDVKPKAIAKKPVKATTKKSVKIDKDEWIARDMEEAGRVSHTVDDWVEKDMDAMGKDPSIHHSVREDMEKYGSPNHEEQHAKHAIKSHADTTKANENMRVEKDMKKAGRTIGIDWLRRDMQAAGKATSTFNDDPTKHAMDDEDKHMYNDVYDDMLETGRAGTQEWVAQDMKRAGQARGDPKFGQHDYSYEVDQQLLDHYNVEDIAKAMEEAGHVATGGAQNDWIRRDMEQVGKSRDHIIANAAPTLDKKLRFDVPSDIRKDMELVGKLGNDEIEWIAQDMERAGHEVEDRLDSKHESVGFRDEEARQIMAMRKPLTVDYVERKEEVEEESVARVWNTIEKPWKGFFKGFSKLRRFF